MKSTVYLHSFNMDNFDSASEQYAGYAGGRGAQERPTTATLCYFPSNRLLKNIFVPQSLNCTQNFLSTK